MCIFPSLALWSGGRRPPTRLADRAGCLFISVLIESGWTALRSHTTLQAEVAGGAGESCGNSLSRRTPVACRKNTVQRLSGANIRAVSSKCSILHCLVIKNTHTHKLTLSAGCSGGRETRLPAVGTSRAGLTASFTGHTRQGGESSSRTQLRLGRTFNCREKFKKTNFEW